LLPVVFGALVLKLSVWCGAEGYVSGLRAAIKTSVASSWHFISTCKQFYLHPSEKCEFFFADFL
jgi:hypothetical protein